MLERTAMIVATPQGISGELELGEFYAFTYAPAATKHMSVAIGMPAHLPSYESADLMPIFEMNLPEVNRPGFCRHSSAV